MTEAFTDNTKRNRFEYTVDGGVAFANYRREGSTLYIDYVEAPVEWRGSGAAGKLMQKIIELAQKENLNVVPICGYAAAWMTRNKLTY
jgi:predicted GNAT family acetyltransferase